MASAKYYHPYTSDNEIVIMAVVVIMIMAVIMAVIIAVMLLLITPMILQRKGLLIQGMQLLGQRDQAQLQLMDH